MVRVTPLVVVVAALGVALWAPGSGPHRASGTAALPAFPAAALTDQLRYVGRDGATGLPNAISDRYIAAIERSYESYYVEDGDPVPPPALTGPGVAALHLPSLGVEAPVIPLGLDSAGRLDVPHDAETVGWNPAFTGTPGIGSASFLAAHYEYSGTPGVFYRLSELRPGDEVVVKRSDGAEVRYRVRSAVDYALESIDMGAILKGLEGRESLSLMTCSGPGDGGRYPLRTLVLAERIP